MKKKRLLLIFLFLLLIPSGILLISPYPRQLVFGPKIQGVPLCAWQAAFRTWQRGCPADRTVPYLPACLGFAFSQDLDMSNLSDDETDQLLLSLTGDPDSKVRFAITSQLSIRQTAATTQGLVRLLQDPVEEVRVYAAWCINSHTLRDMRPDILTLVDHLDTDKRALAHEALAGDRTRR